MTRILVNIQNMLPATLERVKNKLNRDEFIALLQGITGFAGAIASKDPAEFIDNALEIAQREVNRPNLGSLEANLHSVRKWMTFGEHYKPLVDSSDLDFDKVDVASVPEIMKVSRFVTANRLEN